MTKENALGQLRRYLAKPPKGAVELVLVTRESMPMFLGRWAIDDVAPALADTVQESVDNYVANGGACDVRAVYTDGQRTIVERHVSPSATEDGAEPYFKPSGDTMSQATNAQRHLEAVMRQTLQQQAMMNQTFRDVIRDVLAQNTELRKHEADARERALRLERELYEAAAAAPAVTPDEQMAQGQQQALELLKPLLPIIAQKLLTPAASTNAVVKTQ